MITTKRPEKQTFFPVQQPQNALLTHSEKLELAVKRGIEAGLLMGAYQWLTQLLHIDHISPIYLLSYAYLALVLLRMVRKNQKRLGRNTFFRNVLWLGSMTSLFAGLTLLFLRLIDSFWRKPISEWSLQHIQPWTLDHGLECLSVWIVGTLMSIALWRLFRYPRHIT